MIEFGAVLGMSTGAAGSLIGEALTLRHRLPRVWAAVLGGEAIAWRAREIARACAALSLEACAIVDARVAAIINTITPGKLTTITTAAVWEADPDLAQARAEAAARTRGVFVAQTDARDDHGTKRIWVRAAAGDVIRFDATIDDLARALKTLGDTTSLDERRAKAIGWIADPAAAHHLIEVARHLARTKAAAAQATEPPQPTGDTDATFGNEPCDERGAGDEHGAGNERGAADDADRFTWLAMAGSLQARLAAIKQDAYTHGLGAGTGLRRRHTVYVHLTDKTLATSNGVLRVEELGPQLATQLTELLGHDHITVKPVIDLHDQVSVHAYEIPDRIRERVRLRHPTDMFPYGAAEATPSMDLDHVTPYNHTRPSDKPGQTSTDNLIPQSRRHHRAKTHGGWRNRRLPNGAIEWTSPHGFRFHVDHTGTHQLPRHQTSNHTPRRDHES
ncbi:HNH endonuclease signature motif containing protein [Kribbella sp. NPDC048928]|uniref:HNH endonuclease signature motif containing protein n=1 Tax=Kribbella sp. NPDC048928 TaxID=3364111 RepID=UPI003720BB73